MADTSYRIKYLITYYFKQKKFLLKNQLFAFLGKVIFVLSRLKIHQAVY